MTNLEIIIVVVLVLGYFWWFGWLGHTKDAPFVPMGAEVVERVMKITEIGPKDVFYDLGSGDGRLVIAAAMHKAKAYGVEIDRLRVLYSRFWIRLLRLSKLAKIIQDNVFKANISDATVVCTYLLPETHGKLKHKLLKELKSGTKVVAVGFRYEEWRPIKVDPRGTIYGPIMLYIIP